MLRELQVPPALPTLELPGSRARAIRPHCALPSSHAPPAVTRAHVCVRSLPRMNLLIGVVCVAIICAIVLPIVLTQAQRS